MNACEARRSEIEAAQYLYHYEVIKIAADMRHVSEHTQKNQIKALMAKWGVNTQIGLIKELLKRGLVTLMVSGFIFSQGNTTMIRRRFQPRRRNETEIIFLPIHNRFI